MHQFMEVHQFMEYWSQTLIAIGTMLLAVGVPWTIMSAGREERFSFYATLDRTYFEIQKLIVEYPHLAQTDPAGKSPEQIVQYNAFAFNVWNFLEAIEDYSGRSRFLSETWECITAYEANLHVEWFRNPENSRKFKPAFRKYIERKYKIAT